MTRQQQLSEELRLVNKVCSLLALPLAKAPEPCDPPRPDFGLTLTDGRLVGLEVTEARDPEVAEAWRGTLPRFQAHIKEALEREGVTAQVLGSIPVDALVTLSKRARAAAVRTIVSIVRGAMPTGFGQRSGSKFPDLGFLGYLAATPAANTSVAFACSGEPLGSDLIQLAIDQKAPKLGAYQALGASEYWLLVVGGATLSGFVTVEDARSRTFTSPFDRTVFLDDSENSEDQHHILTTVDDDP
jgi:hypothetical protein